MYIRTEASFRQEGSRHWNGNLTWSPKLYTYFILIIGSFTIGYFTEILFGFFKSTSVQTFQPIILIYRGVILFIIIVDVHNYIVQCHIP